MKRKILGFAAVALIVASCGGPGKEEFDKSAQTICDCMSKKTAESEADTSSFKIDMRDLDFSLCALGVVGDVDPFDAQMGKALEEKCPDLKPLHDTYVKNSK